MTATLLPEIVHSSLQPLGEALRPERGPFRHADVQEAFVASTAIVRMLVEFWAYHRKLLESGIEGGAFTAMLTRTASCTEVGQRLLARIEELVPTVPHILDSADELLLQVREVREQLDRISAEVRSLNDWYRGLRPPAGRKAFSSLPPPVAENYQDITDVLARLQRGEDH